MLKLFLLRLYLVVLVLLIIPKAGPAQVVNISYAGAAGYNVPLWVTGEAGLLKKQGLTTNLILIEGGSANIQALLANELRFANVAGSASIQATLQGAEVVIVASSYNLIPYSFVVNKDIRSPSELKGKRLAVSRLGGITEVAGRLALEKFGLSPKDLVFFQAGSDPSRIAAVQSGEVAATVIAPPGLFKATSLGLKVLADLGDLGIKYPTSVIAATKFYLAQNRAVVRKFLMAFIEGLHLYAQNKDFAEKVMQKYKKISDQEILSRSHDYFVKNTALVPLTDPVAIKNALPSDKAVSRKIEEFYDNSLILELVSEGFVEKVAKKAR